MPGPPSLSPGKIAATPFDRGDADFVLRSSDNVEFRVHRLILSMASSVFEGMFSVPKPPALSSDLPIPEVAISEDSETLDLFLRVCYPLIEPEVQTLPLLRKVLTAGDKYDAPIVVHAMTRELRQARFMDNDPLRVFAVACLCDLEKEAKVAAEKAVLEGMIHSPAPGCPELDEISAGSYYRLLKLDGTKALASKPKKYKPIVYRVDFAGILPLCRRSGSHASTSPQVHSPAVALHPFTPLDGADIILRTIDSVDFFVHRNIITFGSPTFLGSLRQEIPSGELQELPVYLLSENHRTVDVLLRMCYPVDDPAIHSPDLYLRVASAAHRYRFSNIEHTLRRSWTGYAQKEPLRCYFTAVQCGWEAEARACALQLSTTHSRAELSVAYISEMETVSSVPYRRLLSYAQAVRTAATREFNLVDVRCRKCPPSDSDSDRNVGYPTTISTGSPPSWLLPTFTMAKRALNLRPCGSQLALHLEVGKNLLATVADASPAAAIPTTAASVWSSSLTTGEESPPACTLSHHKIEWVTELLQKYADKVNMAVSAVSGV